MGLPSGRIAAGELMEPLHKAEGGEPLSRQAALRLAATDGQILPNLMAAAAHLRDRHKGRVVSYSRKVFIPLTTFCRDRCGYCTFRRDPGEPGGTIMTPEEVLRLATAAAALGCKEALFSLGDKPEAVYPEVRRQLQRLGFNRTLDYLHHVAELVLKETPLLPHLNPGVMSAADLAMLRPVSVSMGLMLENISVRLMAPGGPHAAAPDKHPRLRLRTLEAAGRLHIPFTTGLLIGIGETWEERIDSLFTLSRLQRRYGHIQEVIIQNFRRKPDIPMRHAMEPGAEEIIRTVCLARLILGGEMNIQVPPNLYPGGPDDAAGQQALLAAGLNDWGGISPLTKDFINPEAPWPQIARLRTHCAAGHFTLKERLAIYPTFIQQGQRYLDPALWPKVRALADSNGYAKEQSVA